MLYLECFACRTERAYPDDDPPEICENCGSDQTQILSEELFNLKDEDLDLTD